MIWPWLLGIFADSLVKYFPKKEVKDYMTETFSALWEIHLTKYCLQHISEIFKPNPPFKAKGAVAQAWSLAEVIRVLEMMRKTR
jgi:glycogen debranching enzyme